MKIKYEFEMMEMDGDFMAVPVGENAEKLRGIVKLNATGAEILKMIQEGKTRQEMVDAMVERYDSSVDEIQSHLNDFLDQMEKAGILEKE